mmetsp:Transcript_17203/g.37345  ORF Transcript_17203/g.37345 Transcript_17203/m.37345 type:complete len:279 (-) Transcript_17203:955-1791(-)
MLLLSFRASSPSLCTTTARSVLFLITIVHIFTRSRLISNSGWFQRSFIFLFFVIVNNVKYIATKFIITKGIIYLILLSIGVGSSIQFCFFRHENSTISTLIVFLTLTNTLGSSRSSSKSTTLLLLLFNLPLNQIHLLHNRFHKRIHSLPQSNIRMQVIRTHTLHARHGTHEPILCESIANTRFARRSSFRIPRYEHGILYDTVAYTTCEMFGEGSGGKFECIVDITTFGTGVIERLSPRSMDEGLEGMVVGLELGGESSYVCIGGAICGSTVGVDFPF